MIFSTLVSLTQSWCMGKWSPTLFAFNTTNYTIWKANIIPVLHVQTQFRLFSSEIVHFFRFGYFSSRDRGSLKMYWHENDTNFRPTIETENWMYKFLLSLPPFRILLIHLANLNLGQKWSSLFSHNHVVLPSLNMKQNKQSCKWKWCLLMKDGGDGQVDHWQLLFGLFSFIYISPCRDKTRRPHLRVWN